MEVFPQNFVCFSWFRKFVIVGSRCSSEKIKRLKQGQI